MLLFQGPEKNPLPSVDIDAPAFKMVLSVVFLVTADRGSGNGQKRSGNSAASGQGGRGDRKMMP